MTGNEYKKLIGRYIVGAYSERGLKVYEEVNLGTSIIGKQRRIDLFVVGPERIGLAVECKYQDTSGTADEKIPYALNDMAAQRVPGVIVYAGAGFSEGVRHLLQGSEQAAYCLPDETNLHPTPRRGGAMNSGTWQLDHVLAQTFKLWDIVLGTKQPLVLDLAPKASAVAESPAAEDVAGQVTPNQGSDEPVSAAPGNDLAASEPLLHIVKPAAPRQPTLPGADSFLEFAAEAGSKPKPAAKPRAAKP